MHVEVRVETGYTVCAVEITSEPADGVSAQAPSDALREEMSRMLRVADRATREVAGLPPAGVRYPLHDPPPISPE